MFDKMILRIVRTGKAHRKLKPLALVLLFCGAALAKWAVSQFDRIRKTGSKILAAFTQWQGDSLKRQTGRRSMPMPGTSRPSHRPTARATAVVLSVCMVFTLMPSLAFAVEAETSLCEHHPVHTVKCGYRKANPGHPCEHKEHTADCYTDTLICDLDEITPKIASGSEAGHNHTHDQGCYVLDCPHKHGEHDGNCGYIETVEGMPCGYVCAECDKPDKDGGATGTTSGNNLPVPKESKPRSLKSTPASTDPNDTNGDGYHDGDVAAFNAIINNNNLSAMEDDPVGWKNGWLVTWNTETPKRIMKLQLNGQNLEGALDLSDLTSLTTMSCNTNNLTELNLSGLTSLENLECALNQLTELDVSGLTGLTVLECQNNENLTSIIGLDSLTSLTNLQCHYDKLTALDVSGLKNLTTLSCTQNPIAFLKLSDSAQLTVDIAAGGTVKLTGYRHSSKSVSLSAAPSNGYAFKEWTPNGTSLTDPKVKTATFTLDSVITMTPVFTDLNAEAVAAAKSAIEGGSYTVDQADAGDRNALKAALAQKINALSGMNATGITVAENNITIDSFNAATAGSGDAPDGTNGDFSFTVALSKGAASDNTAIKTGVISAMAFSGQTNAQAVAAAKSAIEGGSYTVDQTTANNENDLKSWLATTINALSGMNATGITVTAANITVNNFNAATAGNGDDPDGTNGGFSFTVALSKGTASDNTAIKTGVISAMAFSGQTNAQAVAAAKSAIEGGSYTVDQTTANNENDVKSWLTTTINALSGMNATGITVTANNITIDSFNAATAGNGDNPDGTNGDFSFTVALSKGAASDNTAIKTGVITSTPYVSSDATLSSLSVAGATISPAFDPAQNSYAASVSYGVSSVTITAAAAESQATVSGDTGVKALSVGGNTFTITVTAGDGSHLAYTITITRESYSGGGSTSGDNNSSSSSDGGSAGVAVQTPAGPEISTTGTTLPLTPDKDGGVTVEDDVVSAAISAAKQSARQNGNAKSGVAVSVPVNTTAGHSILNVTIPAPTLDKLVGEQVTRFDLTTNDMVSYSFSQDTLKQLDTNSKGGHIVLQAEKQVKLTGTAQATVDSRPVYDITMIYLESGKRVPASTLDGKTITIKLPYIPKDGEETGNLYAVYVDEAGTVHWLTKSSYDSSQKAVIFEASHFSVYGVGYNPAPAFNDTANHWAKNDIDFVASRGLLTGTSEITFSPNTAITRAMFVTALGRLAGVDPAAYPPSGRFTDVASTVYYAPFVEWAAATGIISGAGERTFSPDAWITREQMAEIMYRYAGKLAYTLPAAHEAETFTDAGQISGSMRKAVQAMQQAGVMNGKGGRRFGPKDNATRAEAAAALRRFVEIVMDPAATQGWTQNDAGRFLYYQDGKPIIGWKQLEEKWYYFDSAGLMEYGGWKQISGKWYYFSPDGAMAANTKIDGYEVGTDGARKEE